jgi:hypothetical protein
MKGLRRILKIPSFYLVKYTYFLPKILLFITLYILSPNTKVGFLKKCQKLGAGCLCNLIQNPISALPDKFSLIADSF